MSPEREALEIEVKKLEIDQKLQELGTSKRIDELEVKRRELEINQLGKGVNEWDNEISQLLQVIQCTTINNEKTGVFGSDPVVKSIWNEDEIEELKTLIMKKVRKL